MKLSKEQLTQIKDFISSRGFTYYDVQLEIIDHVACKVEELMTADATLTLDAALQKAHGQFGALGFSVIEDGMRTSLQKKYFRLFRKIFLSYLKPVYLPLVAGFVYLIYFTCKALNAPVTFANGAWVLVFALLLVNALASNTNKQRYKQMLTARMGNLITIALSVTLSGYNLANTVFKDLIAINPGWAGLALGIFSAAIIICFFTLRDLQKIADKKCRDLEEQYMMTVGVSYQL